MDRKNAPSERAAKSEKQTKDVTGLAERKAENREHVVELTVDVQDTARRWFARTLVGVNRGLFKTGYYIAYGVVFPTCLLASFVPTDNAMGRGLIDGARAARTAVHGLRHRPPAPEGSAHSPA